MPLFIYKQNHETCQHPLWTCMGHHKLWTPRRPHFNYCVLLVCNWPYQITNFRFSARHFADRHFHSIIYTWIIIAYFAMKRADMHREMSEAHSSSRIYAICKTCRLCAKCSKIQIVRNYRIYSILVHLKHDLVYAYHMFLYPKHVFVYPKHIFIFPFIFLK